MTTRFARTLALLLLALAALPAAAQDFSVLVSPPRFEERAAPGQTWRGVLEVTNVSAAATTLSMRTADWILLPDGAVDFDDALQPSSCRPWVGLEAAQVRIDAGAKRRYRFEVAVPAGASPGECRFALMVEGAAQQAADSPVPVAGRIGVIVYLAVGDAAPALAIAEATLVDVDGRRTPALRVRNAGNAHGRLEGLVDGVDAEGRRFAFAPSGLPILPGETRTIALVPQGDTPDAPPPALAFPLRIKGRLDTAAGPLAVEAAFAP